MGLVRGPSTLANYGLATKHVRKAYSSTIRSLSSFDSELTSKATHVEYSVQPLPGAHADELCDLLLGLGAVSTMVKEFRKDNAPEQEIFAGEPGSKEYWNACQVIVCFPLENESSGLPTQGMGSDKRDHLRVIDHAVSTLGLDSSVQQHAFISPRNWEDTIRDSYQPLRIENGLWIIPRWTDIRDNDAINIILEPGIAFGTGDHATTRLCLSWLNQLQEQGLQQRSIMDYGTGSGVLAIGALLMGAESAEGTDIEPLSIKAARYNAKMNNVESKFKVWNCSNHSSDDTHSKDQRQHDIIVANILKGPLIELAPVLAAYRKPTSVLGLSGIVSSQVEDVIQAYSDYFQNFNVHSAVGSEWVLITAQSKLDSDT